MTPGKLTLQIADYYGVTAGRALHAMVAARAQGLIRATPRGHHAIPMEVSDAAAAIVVMCPGGTTPAGAAKAAPHWLSMVNVAGVTFGDALEDILANCADGVAWVRIAQGWPAAVVAYLDGTTVTYGGRQAAEEMGYVVSAVRSDMEIPGSTLRAIGTEIRPVAGGWGRP